MDKGSRKEEREAGHERPEKRKKSIRHKIAKYGEHKKGGETPSE